MRPLLLALILALLVGAARGVEPAAIDPRPPVWGWGQAATLGIVEGVTEFLPVSSTGHLLIANRTLGLDSLAPVRTPGGETVWVAPPTGDRPGEPLTWKAASDAYAVMIQAGGIAAVVVLYWGRLWAMLRGLFGRDATGLRLLRNILVALVPAVVLGLLFEDWIEEHLFSVPAVLAALVFGAGLMFWADRRARHAAATGTGDRAAADLSWRESLLIGLMQCLAFWPGMSRSMVTIVGGYLARLGPAAAAEFSFLLGLPTLTGAALLKSWKSGPAVVEGLGWGPVVLGALVAFVAAALSIRFLVAVLNRAGLTPFAVYRILLALAILLLVGT